MLKLKLPYFGHLIPRADSLEKILMLEKIEGRRIRGRKQGSRPSRPDQEGRKGSEEGVPENLRVPLEGD